MNEAPPVAEIPVAAPAAPVVEAPAAPVAAPAAPVEPPHPAEVPSLLEGVPAPGVTPPAAEAPKADAPPAAPVVEPPKAEVPVAPEAAKPEVVAPTVAEPVKVEWAFEAPENVKIDDAQKTQLSSLLDELLTPKEGETPSHAANRLLAMHADALTNTVQQLRQEQISAFNETRSNWRKEVLADEQIGGAGHQTAMGAIARMRDLSISDHKPGTAGYTKDLQEYEQFLRVTGAGDHPAYLRQLHRFAKFFDEPALPPPNPKPPADIGRNPSQKRSLYAPKS